MTYGPLVSIVTICLNQAPFIEEAINSVLSQDYEKIEYLIIDPGSTDGSREIIDRYRGDLAGVVFEPDDGPPDGLNKGFSRARGEIVGYLNGDDAYLPGAVSGAVNEFSANPAAAAVYGHGFMIDAAGWPIRRFRSSPLSPVRWAYGAALVMQQATFISRDSWLEVGGFNVENNISWDMELMLDLAIANKELVQADRAWGLFRVHEASISSNLWAGAKENAGSKFADIYRVNRRRMFEKVMGREPTLIDDWVRPLGRARRWIQDPVSFVTRVDETLLGHAGQRRLQREFSYAGGNLRA